MLAGAPLQIVLTGAPPGADITLQSSRTVAEFTGGQRSHGVQARCKADAQGRIDLATQAPLSGSHSGADVRGLFWSMTPAKDTGTSTRSCRLCHRRRDAHPPRDSGGMASHRRRTQQGRPHDRRGTAQATSHAQADVFVKTEEFLLRHLGPLRAP